MANEIEASGTPAPGWEAKQVYALAVVCLVIGLAIGYLFRGSQSQAPSTNAMQSATAASAAPAGMGGQGNMAGGHPVTLEQMKQMADKQAEPLLAKLKDDPKDANLLIQVGNIYFSMHQFKEAANYFGKSLEVKPKNVAIRTQMASCLYYSGGRPEATGASHQRRSQGCKLPVQPGLHSLAG